MERRTPSVCRVLACPVAATPGEDLATLHCIVHYPMGNRSIFEVLVMATMGVAACWLWALVC